MLKGSCECAGVRFEADGPYRGVVACHCSQCRKTSGHYWAATSVPDDALRIISDDGLTWYRSSGFAQRGFCAHCGASLFYRMDDEGRTSIAAGCLDGPTGLAMDKHIFTADKGDYYVIPDDAVHCEQT